MSLNKKMLVALLAISGLLNGCVFFVAGSAATGITAMQDRRTLGTQLDDQTIELKVTDSIAKEAFYKQSRVSVTSYNNSVLLVGQVPNQRAKQKAGSLAKKIPKVKKVYNELVVGPAVSLARITKDGVITTEIKTRMLLNKEVDTSRVNVTTENSVVYLMGMVNTNEAESATRVAKKTGGVKKIVRLFEYGNYSDKKSNA